MKKDDYIFYLKKALKGELPPEKVKYYTEYYKNYIDEEVRNGRRQQEVIDELGHPNVIAKSVIEAERMSGGANGYYEEVEEQRQNYDNINIKHFKIKGIIGIILVLLVIFAIISLVMGVFFLLLKIFFPIILIVGLISLIRKLFD